MGKWFGQAKEIERLQRENKVLEAEVKRLQWIIEDLKSSAGEETGEPKKDLSVSAEEARIAATGKRLKPSKPTVPAPEQAYLMRRMRLTQSADLGGVADYRLAQC